MKGLIRAKDKVNSVVTCSWAFPPRHQVSAAGHPARVNSVPSSHTLLSVYPSSLIINAADPLVPGEAGRWSVL